MDEKRVEYKAKIKDMPEDERPRERLIKYGPKHLSTAELRYLIKRKNLYLFYLGALLVVGGR